MIHDINVAGGYSNLYKDKIFELCEQESDESATKVLNALKRTRIFRFHLSVQFSPNIFRRFLILGQKISWCEKTYFGKVKRYFLCQIKT